jgi:hypothetical protein
MALSLEHANSLQVEIDTLEFKKEIFKYQDSGTGIDIREYGDELKAREDQIAELHERLHKLIASLPQMERMAFHNQQTRSFISSLPYEILSAIFMKGGIDANRRSTFALNVSRVSRYWRVTAIQTPFLWSGISILPWRTGIGYGQFLQILLQRSKSHPLDITLTKREFDNPNSRENLAMAAFAALNASRESGSFAHDALRHIKQPNVGHRLENQLGMFIPHVSRWRTFKYNCEALNDVFLVRALLANLSAPILESFDLHLSPRVDSRDDDAFEIFEGGAPKLSRLDMRGIHPFACLPPLSSVTTLRLGADTDKISGDELLDILRSLVALMSLDLEHGVVIPYDLHLRGMQGENVEIVTLRSLSFSAAASPRYCIAGMLDTIRCPAVESMSISPLAEWDIPEDSTYTPPLPPFIRLRYLKLIEIDCYKLARNFDFSSLPALHTIELCHCPSPMALLRLLLPSADQANDRTVWPELQVINLSHVGTEEIDGICRILTHRSSRGQPIDTIIFDPVSLEKHPVEVGWMKQHVNVRRGRRVYYPMAPTEFQFD